jgi:hypothetical protein
MWGRGHAPGQPRELPVAERRGEAPVGVGGESTPVGDGSLMARVVGCHAAIGGPSRTESTEPPET